MNKSIHQSKEICNRLKEKNLLDKMSEYAKGYIIAIMISIFSLGYRGKTVDMASHSDRHRTSISRFLRGDRWDAAPLKSAIKKLVIQTIYEESEISGQPIFVIIDDTICSKTKPSSKAVHPIESAYFHFSHLKRQQDYGHQAVSVMLSCNGKTLLYSTIMYNKSVSKIDLVKQAAEELPKPPKTAYLLCDSWYVNSIVMDAFSAKGFYTVGALKTNRIIYPGEQKNNVAEYARFLADEHGKMLFDIVTVRGRKYYVYRYEGRLNGIDNAVVLICYPIGSFGKEKSLRAFISTDTTLSTQEILNIYVVRWNIEVFFREVKTKLAFDKYQIRSAKGIERYWLITSLVYILACFESESFDFSEGYRLMQQKTNIEHLSFIFDYAANGGDKYALFQMIA